MFITVALASQPTGVVTVSISNVDTTGESAPEYYMSAVIRALNIRCQPSTRAKSHTSMMQRALLQQVCLHHSGSCRVMTCVQSGYASGHIQPALPFGFTCLHKTMNPTPGSPFYLHPESRASFLPAMRRGGGVGGWGLGFRGLLPAIQHMGCASLCT